MVKGHKDLMQVGTLSPFLLTIVVDVLNILVSRAVSIVRYGGYRQVCKG